MAQVSFRAFPFSFVGSPSTFNPSCSHRSHPLSPPSSWSSSPSTLLGSLDRLNYYNFNNIGLDYNHLLVNIAYFLRSFMVWLSAFFLRLSMSLAFAYRHESSADWFRGRMTLVYVVESGPKILSWMVESSIESRDTSIGDGKGSWTPT